VKYPFIEEQRTQHDIRRLCRLLEVSPAGYYEWRARLPSDRAKVDAELRPLILDAYRQSRKTYGRPRIHAELTAQGKQIGEKRVGRLMKELGIEGVRRRRFRKTTDSNHAFPIAENILARHFEVMEIGGKDRAWAGDITYLPTREGWLYLAVVLDLASRRVVGWSMSASLHRDIVLDALLAAINDRKPKEGILFHSDRGCQYASGEFRELLERYGIRASMSGKGECWDNAVVESFFGSMKTELGDPVWENRRSAQAAIFEYIEVWYNRQRRHSTLGYLSPEQYESKLPIAA
jgi:putative transposase